MKQRRSKYAWMIALMISSQILLSGFMAYWLISQYQDERLELHTRLKGEYFNIHEQLIDSILLKDLIAPTLHDSVIISLNISGDRKMELQNDC